MRSRERTEFRPIPLHRDTVEMLEERKGKGKTWDRFVREIANLPLDRGAHT